MSVESALLVFEQVVQQVDGHNQQRDDHGGDYEAGAKVDAFARKVHHFAILTFEFGFLATHVRGMSL